MAKLVDETGKMYGRWTVLRRAPPTGGAKTARGQWVCRCTCGKEAVVPGDHLRLGRSKSCGCVRKERSAAMCHAHNEKRREARRINPPQPKVHLPRCEFVGVLPRGKLNWRGPNPKGYEDSPRCRGIANHEMPDGKLYCYQHAQQRGR